LPLTDGFKKLSLFIFESSKIKSVGQKGLKILLRHGCGRTGKGKRLFCASRSSLQLRVTAKPTFGLS
jgi:hypothetical protein